MNSFFKNIHIGEFLRKKCQDDKFTKRIFIISILINVCIYWFFILTVDVLTGFPLLFGDFNFTFLSATRSFLTNPTSLYQYPVVHISINDLSTLFSLSRWPFRSIPTVLFYFLPFYFLPANIIVTGYIYTFCLVIWNFLSCYLIHAIAMKESFKNEQGSEYFKNSFILMSIYLLSIFQVGNYELGNVNIIAGFFVLAGIYYYYQKKEHLTYLAWSIASMFKIFIIVLIPFFIFQGPIKRFLRNAYYFVIPQITTLVMFIFWPNWILDSWTSNWATVNEWAETYSRSGSFARELSNWFSIPTIPLVILFCCLFFPINFWIAYKNKEISFLDRFMIGFITIIVCIPDFVANHNLMILGACVLWISTKSSVMTKRIKILMAIPTIFAYVDAITQTVSLFYILCLVFIYINILKKHFDSRKKNISKEIARSAFSI